MTMAFIANKNRQEAVHIEDAKSQITAVQKSLSPLKNVINNYSSVMPSNNIGQMQNNSLFAKELFDATGAMYSPYGAVDVRSFSIQNIADSYAISYLNVPVNFCASLGAQVHDKFYQVRVGNGVENAEIVWQKGSPFNPDRLTEACKMGSVVQFISEPLENSKSIMGGSAGGHLAMREAINGSTNFKCTINIAGPISLLDMYTEVYVYKDPARMQSSPAMYDLAQSLFDTVMPTEAQRQQSDLVARLPSIKTQKFYQVYSARDELVFTSINMNRANAILGGRVSGNYVVPYQAPYIDTGHNLGGDNW